MSHPPPPESPPPAMPGASPPPPGESSPPEGNGDGFRLGPRIAGEARERLQGVKRESKGATWRGWLLGLLCVVGISAFIPYADFVMRGTNLSFNAFPMIPVVLMLAILVGVQLALACFKSTLGLTRQDLTLIFCMTMVMYSIPGVGFWSFWSTAMTAAEFHARPENQWKTLLQPHLPDGFFVKDPKDPADPGPRPAAWFYTGLPPGASIPWKAWVGPFARWGLVVAMMYGIWFAVSGLLIRRWSEQERLPFPVAQVPQALISGFEGKARGPHWFLGNRLALWGLALTFGIHSWNSLSSYVANIPQIPLMNWSFNTKYLTEPPWNAIGWLNFHIMPSIIGLTFLLSLDVAFSLWFFYVVLKAVKFFFAPVYGQRLVNDAAISQGSGALLALVVFGFWAARTELGRSWLEAWGLRPAERREGEVSPRLLWGLLSGCFLGVVAWLRWIGVDTVWGVAILFLFILVMTGLARLIAEAGVFAAQFYDFPVHLLSYAATPAVLGVQNVVLLTVWDRVFTADWFRIVPIPGLMNALHLSGVMGLRRKTAFSGMALAIALTFGISFFTFLSTVYTQGGANTFGWFFNGYPQGEYGRLAKTVGKVESWREKQAAAAAQGRVIPPEQAPKEARSNRMKLGWIGVGGALMAAFVILRRFLFWWPHPAGYVMWMASFPNDMLWFSFFLGWLCKWLISKFGGMRVYRSARMFFIGMVAGESLAAVFWILVAILAQHKGAYVIRIS